MGLGALGPSEPTWFCLARAGRGVAVALARETAKIAFFRSRDVVGRPLRAASGRSFQGPPDRGNTEVARGVRVPPSLTLGVPAVGGNGPTAPVIAACPSGAGLRAIS